MRLLDVYADIACPFAHVGLRLFVAARRDRNEAQPVLRVKAWPLELVNAEPHSGVAVAEEVEAIRSGIDSDLFRHFDPERFPTTTIPAMAAAAAAYRVGPDAGERFSLAIRDALWERGLDVSDPDVIQRVRAEAGVPEDEPNVEAAVHADWKKGQARQVKASPHFFTEDGDFACPSIDIERNGNSLGVSFDQKSFARFTGVVFS